ncbi:MAG: alanine--glyoxylate aminotransferase family protein [Acidobacteriota bacterium]
MNPPKRNALLFTPGPTRVHPDILAEMARPAIHHRGPESRELHRRTAELCARLLSTRKPVFLSTSSATGLMEAAVRNCVRERCLTLSGGAFGDRWREIVLACGKEAVPLNVEWGMAIRPEQVEEILERESVDSVTLVHNETSTGVAHPLGAIAEVMGRHRDILFLVDVVSSVGGMPIDVDDLGIDVCLAGVQKALALPPGFSFCSVSERAMRRSEAMPGKGFYFDFVRLREGARRYQSPYTPSTHHLFALRRQLERVFSEGLNARFRRHRRMADLVRDWAGRRFQLFAEPGFESDTLTCVKIPGSGDGASFADSLHQEGFQISSGYGKLRADTFRIGHMGEHSPEDVNRLLAAADRLVNGKSAALP